MSLEEFRKKALDDNGEWTKLLDSEYIKSRISRLEALKSQVRCEVEYLTQKQFSMFENTLTKAYNDVYHETGKQIKKIADTSITFSAFNENTAKETIYTKWLDGNNFSERIWKNKHKLLRELSVNLTQGVIRGDSPDKMIKNLSKRMNVSRSRAAALYQTEYTHTMTDARFNSIKDAGFNEYEIDESDNGVTCSECRAMNGKHFKLSEYESSVTAPPFHTRCRGIITAYFAEDYNVAEIEELGKINTRPLKKEFGALKTDKIIVTNERMKHIKLRHPEDYELFKKYGAETVKQPDRIIKDCKNKGTVFFVKHLENTNLNVVSRLALASDKKNLKNSVMTFYRIRQKNLEKLEKKNKLLYKKH